MFRRISRHVAPEPDEWWEIRALAVFLATLGLGLFVLTIASMVWLDQQVYLEYG